MYASAKQTSVVDITHVMTVSTALMSGACVGEAAEQYPVWTLVIDDVPTWYAALRDTRPKPQVRTSNRAVSKLRVRLFLCTTVFRSSRLKHVGRGKTELAVEAATYHPSVSLW